MIESPPLLSVQRPKRRPTPAQIDAFQGVPTSFVADALGGGGALDQTVRPLGESRDLACVAAGPALTADCGPGDVLASFAALSQIQTGDIVVSAFAGFQGCAAAGDRLIGMMRNCGAAGFVTDGPIRDYQGVVDVRMPVWCSGITPASPFMSGPGTVGQPIQIGGQRVETGDMIVADHDGVVVVPFIRIGEIIDSLTHIKTLERDLDAKVEAGLTQPEWVIALLQSDQTKYL